MPALILNGQPHPLPASPTTVADLIRGLDLQGKRIAVEINGDIVPRSRYADTVVAPGDKLEIVAAVGGG